MANNWNAILSNTNNLTDVLAILKKVLAMMGDLSTLNASEILENIDNIINSSVNDFSEKQNEALIGLRDAINIALAAGAGEAGWLASLIADASGKNQQEINDSNLLKSPEFYGALGNTNNDQAVFSAVDPKYIYALSKKYTVPVWRGHATKFIGNDTEVHLDSVNGDTTVCLQIRDNSNYSDISFINNPNETKPWSYAVVGNNSVMNNIGFHNFDDIKEPPNSWGVYLQDRKNITFNSCHFSKNGVSDIAIVDNVHNITINDARNDLEGVSLDIEPNQTGEFRNDSVSRINVNGGHYSAIHVLENSFTAYGIKDVNISNAKVDLLELRGGLVNFKGGELLDVKGNWYPFKDFTGAQNEYLGSLRIDNAQLSENLVKDPHLFDLTVGSTTSYWSAYAPSQYQLTRKQDSENGAYLLLNAPKTSLQQVLMRDFIDLPAGTKHICVSVNHAVENGADANFNVVQVRLYNDQDVLVETLSYKGCRVDINENSGWVSEEGVFRLPTELNITKAKLSFSCKIGASYLIKSVGLYAFSLVSGKGNFNQTLDMLALPNTKLEYSTLVAPQDLRSAIAGLIINTPYHKYKVKDNSGSFVLEKLDGVRLYYSAALTVTLSAATTSPTTHIVDLAFNGVSLGDVIAVSSNDRLGSVVVMTAVPIQENLVRLTIINFAEAISKQTGFNFIVLK